MDPMTQETNNSSVQVKIFDQAYSLCGSDPDYILKLAEYVDSKMRDVAAGETDAADKFSLATLAALNIADEYHRLKTKLEGLEGEERGTSGEEETTEEPDFSGSLVEEVGQAPKPQFTEEDRQRTRETRQRHHTRRRYEKQLLAIANGELVPTREQHKALIAFGRTRRWNRRSPSKS